MLDLAEGDIVNRLNQALDDSAASIERRPDRMSNMRLTHPRATVWIVYAGSRYGKPVSLDLIEQSRETMWSVILCVRNLAGHVGAYALLDVVARALVGARMPNATDRASLVREQFLDEQDGVWRYELVLAVPMVTVEWRDAEDGPLLKHITNLSPFGNTEIVKSDETGETNITRS